MRAVMIERLGDAPRVRDVPEPTASDSLALVQVTAAPLNPIDVSRARGRYYGGVPSLPYVAGSEGVGRVLRGAGSLTSGTRIYYESDPPSGSLAERTVVDPNRAIEVPDGIPDELAACFGIAGLAAWLALEWRGRLQKGETVLILAASGAVGMIAVQAARLMGAGRVVAAARDQGGLEHAKALGADATVDLKQENLAEAFRQGAAGDLHLVIDPLWGPPAVAALQALAPEGRLVQLGQSAGTDATIASATVRGKLLHIIGHTNFLAPQPVKAAAYLRMLRHAARGELRVEHETVPLERVAEAWARQAASPHRKLVLVP